MADETKYCEFYGHYKEFYEIGASNQQNSFQTGDVFRKVFIEKCHLDALLTLNVLADN